MPTINEIASDIRNMATSGDLTYSFRIEDEQIYFWIHETRAMLISQAIAKRQDISDIWVQAIKCLKLIQVDASSCCFDTTGCMVLRSELQLPTTIETALDNSILRVTYIDGRIISKSNPYETKYNNWNKWTAKKAQWYIENGYLYIINENLIDYVSVFALFENPADLIEFPDCNGGVCFDIDALYPVSIKMANDIANYVIKAKVLPFLKFKQDDTNDGNNQDAQLNGNP